ncbi:MAG: 23S rRNA (adenine(2503)-C(2))-methyltransferase RlmN, partial [bacterium]|nr:23S rRNA (adenine(2503)-C(2))-methyltransferase RlmN [bacterium]
MGQGEPLLNYDAVKDALITILEHTEIGPRQITLSTVGVPSAMTRMLDDPDFPSVRFALSLHNAIEDDRKKLIPSHQPKFFEFLIDWAEKFHKKYPGRTHFIGLEYTVVKGENDSEKHLKALIKFASKLGKVRINLIPCNEAGKTTTTSEIEVIEAWQQRLMECGFTCTIRHSQGQDIAAACGQLANKF